MSIAWMTRVWRSPAPKGADRMMLLALADNANDEGFCWPSIRTLSKKCAVSERAARRTVHRLAQSGYVAVEERPGRSTVYHLHAARLTPVAGDTPVVDDPPVADDSPTPVVDDRPPLSPTTGEPSKNRQMNRQQQQKEASTLDRRGDGVAAVDGCGYAAEVLPSGVPSPADMLPAAASFEDRSGLLEALVARGVDAPVAEALVSASDPGHVRAMLTRGVQEAKGPGWYVRAIREGYRPRSDGAAVVRPRLGWDQMRRRLEERGLDASQWGDHFEVIAHDAEGEPLFVERDAGATSVEAAHV